MFSINRPMSGSKIELEVHQRFHKRFQRDYNSRIMIEALDSSDADILIFPEMFLTGYTLGEDVRNHALGVEDPFFDELKEKASESGKHLVFGFPERSGKIRGQIHNSAMVIGPGGTEGTYQKMHMVDFGPFEEWAYFVPGNDPLMFEVQGFRFGVIICYDIFFPELTKHYALNGADAVICVSASPSVTRPLFETVMKARAIENTIYFIYSNLVGFDSRMDFWGGAEIVSPKGKILAKGPYYEETTVGASIDEDVISVSRSLRPTLRDTRMNVRRFLEEL